MLQLKKFINYNLQLNKLNRGNSDVEHKIILILSIDHINLRVVLNFPIEFDLNELKPKPFTYDIEMTIINN